MGGVGGYNGAARIVFYCVTEECGAAFLLGAVCGLVCGCEVVAKWDAELGDVGVEVFDY